MKFSLFLLGFGVVNGVAAQTTDTTSPSNRVFKLDEVVVSASRVKESVLRSPVSVEKVTGQDFRRSPQLSFFEALENSKGVHLIVPRGDLPIQPMFVLHN